MRTTIAELIYGKNPPTGSPPPYGVDAARVEKEPLVGKSEQLFVMRLIADPSEVELLDGKLVFEKRLLARNYDEALSRVGIQVSRS